MDGLAEKMIFAERQGRYGAGFVPFGEWEYMIAFFGDRRSGSAIITPAAASLPNQARSWPVFLGAVMLYGTGLSASLLAASDRLRAAAKAIQEAQE